MAQLVERSHPTPEIRGSIPVIDKMELYCKNEIKEKEAGNGPFIKTVLICEDDV